MSEYTIFRDSGPDDPEPREFRIASPEELPLQATFICFKANSIVDAIQKLYWDEAIEADFIKKHLQVKMTKKWSYVY